MTDQLIERIRRAADAAVRDLTIEDPRSAPEASAIAPTVLAGRARRRWLTATAGVVAAAVVGVFIWLGGRTVVEPAAPTAPPERPASEAGSSARDRLIAAVDATRSAPTWDLEVTGAAEETFWIYEAPDRIEMKTAGPDGEWVSSSVTVGTDMYVRDDGVWTLVRQDWRTAAPFNLLDLVRNAECVAWEDDAIVYWSRPTGGCGAPAGELPGVLPATSELGRVEVDGSGRIRVIRTAEILEVDGQRAIRPNPDAEDLLVRQGATGGVIAAFRYDDVAPVTIPDRG